MSNDYQVIKNILEFNGGIFARMFETFFKSILGGISRGIVNVTLQELLKKFMIEIFGDIYEKNFKIILQGFFEEFF